MGFRGLGNKSLRCEHRPNLSFLCGRPASTPHPRIKPSPIAAMLARSCLIAALAGSAAAFAPTMMMETGRRQVVQAGAAAAVAAPLLRSKPAEASSFR